jgi:transposase-like protein
LKQTNQKAIQQVWAARIAAAEAFDGTVAAYCRTNGITALSFYKWRRRLREESKSVNSSFVPAVIHRESAPVAQVARRNELPDAKWVAEILTHLVRSFES